MNYRTGTAHGEATPDSLLRHFVLAPPPLRLANCSSCQSPPSAYMNKTKNKDPWAPPTLAHALVPRCVLVAANYGRANWLFALTKAQRMGHANANTELSRLPRAMFH